MVALTRQHLGSRQKYSSKKINESFLIMGKVSSSEGDKIKGRKVVAWTNFPAALAHTKIYHA